MKPTLAYRWLPLSPHLIVVVFVAMSLATPAVAEPIRLAAIFALSGKAAQSNAPVLLGVSLAVREINREGGVLGKNLELLILDNNSTPIGSHLAAERAARDGAVAIVGAVWSSHSLAIAKVAEERGLPMISPISTVVSLTAIGDHVFRVCYDDNLQGSALARVAADRLQARSALVFVDLASDFSINLAAIFRQTFERLGGRIVKEIEYKAGQPAYPEQARQAAALDADLVLFTGHDESGLLAEQYVRAGGKAIPLGSDAWDVDSFFRSGGDRISLGYFVNHWSPELSDPVSRNFIKKFTGSNKPNAGTALAYDAVHLLAAAIGKAGSTDSAAIRRALHEFRGFPGVTGPISFDAQGNAHKPLVLMEIRDGRPAYLDILEPDAFESRP